MAKGGARARSGPPPDPTALRRDRDGNDWVILSAAGRTTAAGRPRPSPAWPISICEDVDVDERETELWEQLWALPQAIEWERCHHHLEVALYVRRFVEAEQPGSPAAVSTLVRQLADSLGITEPGMRANRWKIGPKDEAGAPPPATSPRRNSARERFTLVQGGA